MRLNMEICHFFTCGHAEDFNHWRDSGAAGWGYADVPPYFKRMETWQSGDELDGFIREYAEYAESAHHPCGTCKMGAADDTMAVVNPETRVIGVEGLRVADSSIFPRITNGNLNAPSIMVGEKASDHILDRSMLSPEAVPVWTNLDWKTSQRWAVSLRTARARYTGFSSTGCKDEIPTRIAVIFWISTGLTAVWSGPSTFRGSRAAICSTRKRSSCRWCRNTRRTCRCSRNGSETRRWFSGHRSTTGCDGCRPERVQRIFARPEPPRIPLVHARRGPRRPRFRG